ncbi:mCG12234, isoform CRA_b [Mus musculus]|nr:mCG12234, isoform CRA_b [Mus musculus]
MGSQSSKAPRGDVTAEEAAGASPAKANGQENGHVRSNGDLTPKGEGESPPPHPCRRQLLGFQFFSKFVLFILLLNPLSQKWGLILPNPECPAFPLLNS